jgi:hypothetical protein
MYQTFGEISPTDRTLFIARISVFGGLLSVFERKSHGVSGETRRRMQASSQLQRRQVKSTQRVQIKSGALHIATF